MTPAPCKRCLNQPVFRFSTAIHWLECKTCGIAPSLGHYQQKDAIRDWNKMFGHRLWQRDKHSQQELELK